MPRAKKQTDPKIPMIELLFGKGVSVEFAEKMLTPDWFENLEKHYKPAEVEKPVESAKSKKEKEFKKMYEKVSGQVKKLNDVITKFETGNKELDDMLADI